MTKPRLVCHQDSMTSLDPSPHTGSCLFRGIDRQVEPRAFIVRGELHSSVQAYNAFNLSCFADPLP